MANANQPNVLIYHYSSGYRDVATGAIEAAGLSPQIFEDPEIAQRALDGSQAALIAPNELYVPISNDELSIVRPSDDLVRYAEVFDTPWALIAGPTASPPYQLLSSAPKGSVVIATGEPLSFSPAERLLYAESPDDDTKRRVAFTLTSWLVRLQENRSE
jgi:hypothetical protein